jgi:hypothetical protein
VEDPVDEIIRLAAALDGHDLDAAAGLLHESYRSEHGSVVAGRLYLEEVDPISPTIDEAVERLSGSRPRLRHDPAEGRKD